MAERNQEEHGMEALRKIYFREEWDSPMLPKSLTMQGMVSWFQQHEEVADLAKRCFHGWKKQGGLSGTEK